MNKNVKLAMLCAVLLIGATKYVQATTINLQIEGEGSVVANEANDDCNEDCVITNTLPVNTLIAEAGNGWRFDRWQGQQCDAGDKVLLEADFVIADTTNGGAKTLVDADVNGDGVSDLASINLFDGEVSILTNQGDGHFSETIIASKLNYPAAMAFYDWENDGDQDLLVTVYGEYNIYLFANDGNGEFELQEKISLAGYKPYAISVNDINDDQRPDLLISSFSADVSGDLFVLVTSIQSAQTAWFLNTGDDFVLDTIISEKAAITLDSYVDSTDGSAVAVAAEIVDSDLALYRTANNQVERSVIKTGGNTYGATFGDIDDNGIKDILVSDYQPAELSLFYGQPDNTFSNREIIHQASQGLTATAIADVNNDGYKDVLSGIFNLDYFFYIPTKSYNHCVINKQANINLTAVFVEAETTPLPAPTPAPSPAPPATELAPQSSGGSFGFLLLIILALPVFRAKQKK